MNLIDREFHIDYANNILVPYSLGSSKKLFILDKI